MARKAGGAGTKHLTKDELFDKLSVRTEEFELPGGAGTITLQSVPLRHIRNLTGVDAEMETNEALKRICLVGIRDPELAPEDLDRLDDSNAGAVNVIANRIMELSGMMGDGAAAFLGTTPPPKDSSTTASKSSDGSPASSET